MDEKLKELEERLGWKFSDRALLACALTAPSCRMDDPSQADNQRLEFLGDAVFGLLAADALYRLWPGEQEGALTVRRIHLVSGATLAGVAERIGLRSLVRRSAGAGALKPGAKVLADAMEAVMGAVWLDGGWAAAKCVFEHLALPVSERYDEWGDNPKGKLQILAQSLGGASPVYETISRHGPAHAPVFRVRVSAMPVGMAEAEANTLKTAEQTAAAKLLKSHSERNVKDIKP